MAIQMRRGEGVDLDISRLSEGEFAVCLDTEGAYQKYVVLKLSGSNYMRIGSYDDIQDALNTIAGYDATFREYLENCQEYSESANANAENSEAWAVGTRDGEPVESSDPTYHNNSKYIKEQIDEMLEESGGYLFLNPRGQYNVSTEYDRFDWVRYNNASWVCKLACVGQTPAEGTYWTLLAQDGSGSGASRLSELTDVLLASLQNGQTLIWDNNAQKWKNGNAISKIADASDVSIDDPSNGQVLTYNSETNKFENQTPSTPSTSWGSVTGKPFNGIDSTTLGVNGSNELYVKGATTSGQVPTYYFEVTQAPTTNANAILSDEVMNAGQCRVVIRNGNNNTSSLSFSKVVFRNSNGDYAEFSIYAPDGKITSASSESISIFGKTSTGNTRRNDCCLYLTSRNNGTKIAIIEQYNSMYGFGDFMAVEGGNRMEGDTVGNDVTLDVGSYWLMAWSTNSSGIYSAMQCYFIVNDGTSIHSKVVMTDGTARQTITNIEGGINIKCTSTAYTVNYSIYKCYY